MDANDRLNVREVLTGLFYVRWTGCQGGPKGLPPKSTVH